MSEPYNGWSVLELLGHRRLHGLVQETTLAGAGFLRIDVYEGPAEAASATQFYPPSSVYCLTPATEEACRKASMPWAPPALWRPQGNSWPHPAQVSSPFGRVNCEDDDCELCGKCCDDYMADTAEACLRCGNPRGGCDCD